MIKDHPQNFFSENHICFFCPDRKRLHPHQPDVAIHYPPNMKIEPIPISDDFELLFSYERKGVNFLGGA